MSPSLVDGNTYVLALWPDIPTFFGRVDLDRPGIWAKLPGMYRCEAIDSFLFGIISYASCSSQLSPASPVFFREFLFPSLLHIIRDPFPTLGDIFNPCIPAFGVKKRIKP